MWDDSTETAARRMHEAIALGQMTWLTTTYTPLSADAAKLKAAGIAIDINCTVQIISCTCTLTILVFAEYLRDAVMANHLPTVKFLIQNFDSLVNHVYTQCEPLHSPLYSAIFPRHYLGGVSSKLSNLLEAWNYVFFVTCPGSRQTWRDCIPGVRLKMRGINVLSYEGIEERHKHTPLTYAAAFGQTGILEYLVQQKADIYFHSSYPVFCQYGEEKCSKVNKVELNQNPLNYLLDQPV